MLTLKELVQKFSAEDLDTLRKTLHLKPEASDTQKLLQRLDNSERTRKLFAELTPTEKHVLRYLFSQAGETSEDELLQRMPDAASSIAKLKEHFVIFQDQTDEGDSVLRVPREYARFISLTPAEKSTLANLLSKQPLSYLEDLGISLGQKQGSRYFWIQQLKSKWHALEKVQPFIDALPESEQHLWKSFIRADGILDVKALKHAGSAPALMQPGHLDRALPLEHLYAEGLVFPNQWPNPACFIVPSDILSIVKGKTPSKQFEIATSTPAQLRTSGLRLLSDIQLFSAYQASGRLQFTHNDIPLRHQLRAFMKALGVPEENYGLFINMSMDAFFGRVIKKTTQTLDSNPAESMSKVIVHWRDGETWQESSVMRDSRRSSDGRLDKTLKAKRLIVLKVLEDLPTGQWVTYADFAERVFASGWKRVDTGSHKPNAFYDNDRWNRKEFSPDSDADDTLANMTAECLVWFGLVDVGVGKLRKSGWTLTHLRLTDWGRQFLDKSSGRFEPLPPVPTETQFRVLPNLEISVSPRLRPDLISQLFKIAVLKGVNSFALTKTSLREALDEGMTRDDIVKFLQANAVFDVPTIVLQYVDEIAQKHGHIKLGIAGAYLQVDDPMLMLELRSQRTLKDIFRKQIGDQLSILNDKDLEKIAKTLRKLGYSPVIEKSDETERLKQKFHW